MIGLGKFLKSIFYGDLSMKIYMVNIILVGLCISVEVVDGVFLVWMNFDCFDVLEKDFNEGFVKIGNSKDLFLFDIVLFVMVNENDDLDVVWMFVKFMMVFYIGGMGVWSKNFYNDYVKCLGFEEVVVKI